MIKNNLLLMALAASVSLTAYGQQADGGISPEMLKQIQKSYEGTPSDKAIRNAISANNINKLAINSESLNNFDTYFSDKVESKGISNQKSSGRCWLFTGLNVLRAKAIAKYDMGRSSGISWKKPISSFRASSIPARSRKTTRWSSGCSRIRSATVASSQAYPTC